MEDVGIFYGHLIDFIAILCILGHSHIMFF
jgi:hypothetical protein